MLPPLLKVAATGSYGDKCVHIRVNVLTIVRLHVLLHVLYASSAFSSYALFVFFHMP